MNKNSFKKRMMLLPLFLIIISSCIFIYFFCFSQTKPAIKPEGTKDIYSEESIYIAQVEKFLVPTRDGFDVTLTRYKGNKSTPMLLIHGMGGNHLMFDWDDNHSLARFLNKKGWDVWLLDLRTHDGDGDFFFVEGSDREYINRYWDFDRTLLKIDVVTAVDFVKEKAGVEKLFLSGHSYGGYLAYAYSMLIGEENLAGIITTGASPYANPIGYQPKRTEMIKYGFYLGKKAFVNPIGLPRTQVIKAKCDLYFKNWEPSANAIFYYSTTTDIIQKNLIYKFDSEPAGVWVDIYFGKDPNKYGGHWVDPQTLYDYSENLDKITVPILFISGEEDLQDPSDDIYRAYQHVSSKEKEYYCFPEHSHMDLLLGEQSSTLIFPKIDAFMGSSASIDT